MKKLLIAVLLCKVTLSCLAGTNNFDTSTGYQLFLTNQAIVNEVYSSNQVNAPFTLGVYSTFWVTDTSGMVSNTTSETSILNTNTLRGRTIALQTNEMFAGKSFVAHWYGYITSTSGQTCQYRIRWGGMSGTVIADTGALTALNATTALVEFEAYVLMVTTNSVRSWMNIKIQGVGDLSAQASSRTNYVTVTNTVQQPIVFTAQPNNTAYLWQTSGGYCEVR